MKNHLNYTYRVVKNGKTLDKCQTHSYRRFYNRIRTIKWQSNPSYVYLRVSYGRGLNNRNEKVSFYNDGEYQTKKELLFALNAFAEDRGLPEKSEETL